MPQLDGTGPAGKGPKTGGQMGDCTDAKAQGRPFNGLGEGAGRSRGQGQGRRGRGRGLGRARFNV